MVYYISISATLVAGYHLGDAMSRIPTIVRKDVSRHTPPDGKCLCLAHVATHNPHAGYEEQAG